MTSNFPPNYRFKVTIQCKYEANPGVIEKFVWNFNNKRKVSEVVIIISFSFLSNYDNWRVLVLLPQLTDALQSGSQL